jgi:SpoVK/Ycf46/Vps4 family AAA+-type ATPase
MGVLIVNDNDDGEDGNIRVEGMEQKKKINLENRPIAGSRADVTDIISKFSNLGIDQKIKDKSENDTDKNENGDTQLKEGDLINRKNEKIPILTSSQPLTTSFISQIASKAHGMVACDLLQVVKESFYISLCRRNKEGQIGRENTSKEGMGANAAGDVDSRTVLSSAVVDSPAATTKPTATIATAIAITSAVENVIESVADDGMYRPTNLTSDYEEEEMEEDEGEEEEENCERETFDQIDGMSKGAPASSRNSHQSNINTNSTAEEELLISQHTRTEASSRPLQEVPGSDPRTDPRREQEGPPGSDMSPVPATVTAPVPVSCGALTEGDLQLALNRIAPSALRCVRVSCRTFLSYAIVSYRSNALSYLILYNPLLLFYPRISLSFIVTLREVAIEVPCVRWADIGGMEGVKRSLREVDHEPQTLILLVE